jgi:hypothetical protein
MLIDPSCRVKKGMVYISIETSMRVSMNTLKKHLIQPKDAENNFNLMGSEQ